MASAVTKLLSDQRVRLADGALQRIEAAVEKIKANGKNSLVVRNKSRRVADVVVTRC